MILFSLLCCAPLAAVFAGPALSPWGAAAAYFVLGCGSFGPHILVGLVARELYPAVPSTAGSFVKALAQVIVKWRGAAPLPR
jgi:sugar phosphate permease